MISKKNNKMKHKNFKYFGFSILTLFFVLTLVSCGPKENNDYPWLVVDEKQDDEDDGEGGAKVTLEVLEGELLEGMSLILNYDKHKYQYLRANSIDNYAGYMTVSQNNFIYGGPLPTLYTYPNPYLHGSLGESFRLYPQLYNAYFYAEQLGKPQWKAIAEIMYGYKMHELIDFYDAIPFDDYRNKKQNPPLKYESGEQVYFKIFAELEHAVKVLKETKPSAEELRKIEGPQGGLSQGDWKMWVKFANSIRLRMAMNMVKAKPSEAQQIAEAAVNDDIGVLTVADADIAFTDQNSKKQIHPLYFISEGWDDLRVGASIISILEHFKNPLIHVWFTKNSYPIYSKSGNPTGYETGAGYFGIRQGVAMIDKSNKSTGYGMYSTFKISDFPRSLLKVAEVLFTRSEGALRGWNMGGSAESFYYDGIKRIFDDNKVSDAYDAYIEQEELPAVDHIDPFEPENNIKGRVTCGVRWNEGDTEELKLEKIITQKYIANFSMGAEAWTTFRRTGYPRLFPVKINNFPGVNTEFQIRRIPYIQDDNNASDFVNSLYPAIGGAENNSGGVGVWWDVEPRGNINAEGIFIPQNF